MAKLLGVVLAGGQSRRMGADKARLAWGDRRFIDHAVYTLRAICSEGVWVGGRDYGHPYFEDLAGFKGPMASIGALPKLPTQAEFFVILPVDMPQLNERMLLDFAATAEARAQRADGDCVGVAASQFPLLLRRSERVFAVLREVLVPRPEGVSPSLRAFLERLSCVWLDGDLTSLMNVNDPGAYAEALKHLEGRAR